LELAAIRPPGPQPGCGKKGCKRTWNEHLTKKGTVRKEDSKNGHFQAGQFVTRVPHRGPGVDPRYDNVLNRVLGLLRVGRLR
jgi:hypothetical protein